MTRPPYPTDFRAEAVRLIRNGQSLSQVAHDLGVFDQSLRNWVRQADGEQTEQALKSGERSEGARLRRRVKVLEQEREILKKLNMTAWSRHRM